MVPSRRNNSFSANGQGLLVLTILAVTALSYIIIPTTHAFLSPPHSTRPRSFLITTHSTKSSRSSSSSDTGSQQLKNEPNSSNDDEDDPEDDASLLQTVTKTQLKDLCTQMSLATKGTKEELLKRLRDHAAEQAALEGQRNLERVQRVEEGSDDPKQRYEMMDEFDIDNDDDDEDTETDEGFFYFNLPEPMNATQKEAPPAKKRKPLTWTSSGSIAAPPPPKEPNEKGERVVQIYSTTDQNDMTGVAAAQPGQAAMGGDALSNTAPTGGANPQPWDMDQSATTSETSTRQMDEASAKLIELVQALLAMSGAPAFVGFAEDLESMPTFDVPETFIGFNPGQVPGEMLTASSQALRTGRGEVLQDVLRQFELQAIGQDGMHGDKTESGGGHYREVSKVRAFLEGYRRAEVRKLARETTALLLDKLVQEGVEGLDMTLASMTRSSDDTSDYAGELNDSLLEYLKDAIRQQEKKVDQYVAAKLDVMAEATRTTPEEFDPVEGLWNVTTEDGKRVESIDPNDPKVQQILQEEFRKEEYLEAELVTPTASEPIGQSAPEQLLLLLTLLRERIKAEAAFAPDEKGRNLRLLAYCLRVSTNSEREQLILKDVGNSLDRLDSLMELIASSIEYGESTTHQLQPAKTRPLNVRLLKSILALVEDLHERQSIKASGVKTN